MPESMPPTLRTRERTPRASILVFTIMCLALATALVIGCRNTAATNGLGDATGSTSSEHAASNTGDNAAATVNSGSETDSTPWDGDVDAANGEGAQVCLFPPDARTNHVDFLSVGEPIADFTLTDISTGDSVTLSDHRGGWVLLKFWASWCPECRKQSELFIRPLFDEVASAAGSHLTIIAVGVSTRDTVEAQRAYAETHDQRWIKVYDEGGAVAETYGIAGTPTVVLVDPDGNVATFAFLRDDDFAANLNAFLRQECIKPD